MCNLNITCHLNTFNLNRSLTDCDLEFILLKNVVANKLFNVVKR